ncbi:MAG: hypothetical protein ABL933_08610 [Methyloglobulus sp.]|nr:polysaccharide deacetylase family protein [Methyloglobulus sp.]
MNSIQTYTQPGVSRPDRRRKPRTRKLHHWHNLVWWLVLLTGIVAVQKLPGLLDSFTITPAYISPTLAGGTEKEAFMSLVFGRISPTRELAISDAAFKKHLEALKQNNYSSVRLNQITRWQSGTAVLPIKPVLLTFEEASREAMELADKLLAKLEMTALVFVDINKLDEGNINLVSWHKLEQMVKSGRWEVGISGCPDGDNPANYSSMQLAEKLAQRRKNLEQRLKVAVIAADCPYSWDLEKGQGETVWNQALDKAGFKIGFTAAPYGANYKDDYQFGLRRIRVAKDWGSSDLLAQIKSHAPRLQAFADNFNGSNIAPEWVIDSGEIGIEHGALRMVNKTGEEGALLTLAGTEKWQDADVQVKLKGQPKGQFWIILRYRVGEPMVRLGVSGDQVLLQTSESTGDIRQLASRHLSTNNPTLRFRVIGRRAMAYIDGQSILPRPVELPKDAGHGTLALAVWRSEDAGGEATANNKASVYLDQFSATPLSEKTAIVTATLEPAAWKLLREQSGELSIVSPYYFAWREGKPYASEQHDFALETFTHHHRMQLMPSLFIAKDAAVHDASTLIDQALLWAANPAYQGLNIILEKPLLQSEWRQVLDELRLRMTKAKKTLTVTLLGSEDLQNLISEHDGLFEVVKDSKLFSAKPGLFSPVNNELTVAFSKAGKSIALKNQGDL